MNKQRNHHIPIYTHHNTKFILHSKESAIGMLWKLEIMVSHNITYMIIDFIFLLTFVVPKFMVIAAR